jgi:polysaccharide pyruvyl transferase CsaB
MARILISGYYGFGNTGDELILFSLLNSLRRVQPDLEITVLSANPAKTAGEYQVKAINRGNILAFLKELKNTDLFISGGGGLLQDITSFSSSFYYLGLFFLAQFFGKKTFLYAQGIGPLKNRFLRFSTRFILNRVTGITLRDENSKFFLQSIGVSHPGIEVTADPVFALNLEKGDSSEEKKELRRIGFILRRLKPNEEKILVEVMYLIQDKLGVKIFLLSFQEKEDLPVCEKLAKNRIELFRWENFNQLFDFFSTLDMVVSMRLHGLILGILQNKPVVGLSDDPKISALAEIFSFPVFSRDDLKNKNLVDSVIQIWQEREKYCKIVVEKIPELRRKAEKTAELALVMLK